MTRPLLEARDVRVSFEIRHPSDLPWTPPLLLHAVNSISFRLGAARPSASSASPGCGKSTLARADPDAAGDRHR